MPGAVGRLRMDAITLIESVYSGLTSAICDTANQVIPKMAQGTLKSWWNNELSTLKHNTILSHGPWLLVAKPNVDALFLAKRHDKLTYKLVIRKYKTKNRNSINDSLLKALNNSDFWKLWKSKLGKLLEIKDATL